MNNGKKALYYLHRFRDKYSILQYAQEISIMQENPNNK
jgi:hypothetical protein